MKSYNIFQVGVPYTKKDIYRLRNVPSEQQGGNWDTGYNTFENDIFIFANLGTAGRTGHDYNNHWKNKELVWYGKVKSHINQKSIQNLLHPIGKIYIFTRVDSELPFTFSGEGVALDYSETIPVCIIWGFDPAEKYYPEEIIGSSSIKEGAVKSITVNRYERDSLARKICIDHHGAYCKVCEFDFEKFYGPVGSKYIHVHHVVEIHTRKGEYIVDPINDLVPVCPNCHAMMHRRMPPFSVIELKDIVNNVANK